MPAHRCNLRPSLVGQRTKVGPIEHASRHYHFFETRHALFTPFLNSPLTWKRDTSNLSPCSPSFPSPPASNRTPFALKHPSTAPFIISANFTTMRRIACSLPMPRWASTSPTRGRSAPRSRAATRGTRTPQYSTCGRPSWSAGGRAGERRVNRG